MKSIPPIHKITGRMSTCIYIIEGDDELVLVDTGVPRDYRHIVDRIKSLGRSPVEVGHILLTHFHIDHAGSAAALKRLSQASVYAHEDDVPYLQGDDHTPSVYKSGVLGRAAMIAPKIADRVTRVPPVQVDCSLKDGEVIPILGGMKVFHTPGHTPGSACFFWEEKGILFSGDTIVNSLLTLGPPTMGFSTDFDQAMDSAINLIDTFEDENLQLVCPAHGPMVKDHPNEKLKRFRGKLIKRRQ